jgi:hypothetical protein
LIHAVLGCVPDDVINSTAAVAWRSMFADMLDTPVSKLSVGDNVNVGQYFLDTRSL